MTWTDDRNQPQARVLLDSVSPLGHRPTTFEVTMHRFVLAELNTHRVLSRNSASSRAIPVAKMIEKVMNHPAMPVSWPAEQKGMQGGEELTGHARARAQVAWTAAKAHAVSEAQWLVKHGVHKSVVNRLLEPFAWHTAIVSGTSWEGFWAQRCSPLAQPEIRAAAEAMKAAYDASEPTPLAVGEWHTPLIQPDEDDAFWHSVMVDTWVPPDGVGGIKSPVDARKVVSAARCARVSYLTHDGHRDIEEDLSLYEGLVTARPGHWSPLEHVATPCLPDKQIDTPLGTESWRTHKHRGNFAGFDQHRHEIEAAR